MWKHRILYVKFQILPVVVIPAFSPQHGKGMPSNVRVPLGIIVTSTASPSFRLYLPIRRAIFAVEENFSQITMKRLTRVVHVHPTQQTANQRIRTWGPRCAQRVSLANTLPVVLAKAVPLENMRLMAVKVKVRVLNAPLENMPILKAQKDALTAMQTPMPMDTGTPYVQRAAQDMNHL